jgi:hypothetical protein
MPAKSFRVENPVRWQWHAHLLPPRHDAYRLVEHQKSDSARGDTLFPLLEPARKDQGFHFSLPFYCIFRPFSLKAGPIAPYNHQRSRI